MPQKRRSQSWTELKQAGNECFRAGQYGEAVNLYSQSIQLLEKSGQKKKEDLGILYSNRAASYLKDGNCSECIKDCTTSLELIPFGFKALLRRASAYEALERYRQAYVDYKTVLQIDWNIPAAHDGVNRMTKALTDIDGPSWREKLPPIPTVPMSVKESLAQAASLAPSPQQNSTTDNKKKAPGPEAVKKAKALKEEGNVFVKKGEHKKAVEKYTQSLGQDPTEVTTYTNRALCYLSLKMYKEAINDCDEALRLDSANIKAFYRRAQANKELKNKKSAIEDLNSVLKKDPNNMAAQKLLQEVQKMK
ncbi:mitochondrial import receptor subunit TOM34 isoform X1 [Carassius auratus]|uniref:Mitochondrial import receptor subunit TOM34 isoform X1 n=1 Tax=Carassius auratus TaxID=7957 RepID=A0A6P6PL49_CARAU|nr:mitochondrial import receptor subunit TOM34-like isoform X1 [Carassius auratus]XP_052414623.1 mitochondrial import receptor subunit TOM34-like isoform X1 [Carassius gibelio]